MADRKEGEKAAAAGTPPRELDGVSEKKLARFLDEYGSPEHRRAAMERAIREGMVAEAFAEKFQPVEDASHPAARRFVQRVREVLGERASEEAS